MKEKIYDLKNDYVFKKILKNKPFCKMILKDLFYIQLENFHYGDKEFTKENKEKSYGICDVVVETGKEIIIIEMQNKDYHNIEKRAMLYLSKMYTEQWKTNNYTCLKPVTLCLILNYKYQNQYLLKYQMLEQTWKKQFGNTIIKEIQEYNQINNKKIKEVFIMNWTKEEEIGLCTMTAREEGRIEGEKIGEKIGEKLGEKKALKNTIKNMIKNNFNIETIKIVTGLSEQEIKEYQHMS